MKTAMPSAIGVAMQQREHRRIERAPDERQRAELAGHRIPDRRCARSRSRTSGSTAIDCRASSKPIATTISDQHERRTAPVPSRNPRSFARIAAVARRSLLPC